MHIFMRGRVSNSTFDDCKNKNKEKLYFCILNYTHFTLLFLELLKYMINPSN